MARTAKKTSDRSSLVISIVVHALALGGLAYLAHKAGFVPQAISQITGIQPPEKPKPKPKPPEPTPPRCARGEVRERPASRSPRCARCLRTSTAGACSMPCRPRR